MSMIDGFLAEGSLWLVGLVLLLVTTIVFMLLSLAMTLILDLDRPRTGSVLVSQQPMLDVRAAMR